MGSVVVVGCTSDSGSNGSGSSSEGGGQTGEDAGGGEDVGGDASEDVDPQGDTSDPDVAEGVQAHTRPLEERLAPMVECLEEFVADDNATTGVAVAVLEEGEVAWSRGFGVVGLGQDRQVADTTLFRFGSVLKMMSSTALLSFVDDGRLQVDTPLGQVIPNLSFSGANTADITPHRLMTHQGGFEDVLSIDGPREDEDLGAYLLGESFQEILFLSPPGSFYNYSNPNFYLTGYLAEVLDGTKPYRSVMQERVFAPLGMDRTFFLSEDVLEDGDFAYGAGVDFLGQTVLIEPDAYDNAWARPAGYGWASVLDIAKFLQFVMYGNEEVLSRDTWQALRSPQVNTQEFLDLVSYGYGLSINQGFFLGENFYTTTLLSHSGAIDGYGASTYIVPDGDYAIVVLTNSLLASPGRCVALGIAAEMERWDPSAPPNVEVDTRSFRSIAGQFADATGRVGDFTIRVRGDGLELIAPQLDRVGYEYERLLTPTTQDNFLWNTSQGPIPLTAIREEDGSVRYIRSRIFVGTRKSSKNSSRERLQASSKRLGELSLPLEQRAPQYPGWFIPGGL